MHRLQPQRLGNGALFSLWGTCSSAELGSFPLAKAPNCEPDSLAPLCEHEKIIKWLGFWFLSFLKIIVIIVDLPLLQKDVVSKKEEIIIMIDIWALWRKVIYKTQIKLWILIKSINILLVSKGTVCPKPHSVLDTTTNSHDLISEHVTVLAKRVWPKWSIFQPQVFLVHTFSENISDWCSRHLFHNLNFNLPHP